MMTLEKLDEMEKAWELSPHAPVYLKTMILEMCHDMRATIIESVKQNDVLTAQLNKLLQEIKKAIDHELLFHSQYSSTYEILTSLLKIVQAEVLAKEK